MKTYKKVSEHTVRIRLFKSFLLFGLIGIAIFGGYKVISQSTNELGTPVLLRRVLDLNQKVSQAALGTRRNSAPEAEPGPGITPRVNGDIGLSEDLADDLDQNPETYVIQIKNGDVESTVRLDEIVTLPQTEISTLFKCVEGWSQTVQYSGVKFSDFMERFHLGRKSDGGYYSYVGLETPDHKYFVSIDMQSMLHEQSVLALKMNREPLSFENGAPLRLIIPIKYGIKSLKRIGSIVFTDARPHDFWNERGYDWYSGL